jgi:small-conductance mechanosensitive channel
MKENMHQLEWIVGLLGAVLLAGIMGHYLIFKILLRFANRTKSSLDNSFVKHCYRPMQWTAVLFIIRLVLPAAELTDRYRTLAEHVLSLLFIGLVSWLLIKISFVLEDYILSRFRVDEKDNLRARKIHTQLRVLKRIITTVVGILALGTMLMTFDKVRQLGTTILASAGIIGIVVGMAAQRTIGTFIAGLQIAFTQPIRVDDVVIVENEWGRIEEITLTYVVVKIWDLRRLVVPITYFIEKPFQNWTRITSDLLGTVYLYLDYTIPIQVVRNEFDRILKKSDHWDGKVNVVQVTNATDKTVEVRALMSASDSSSAWTLRCEVREKLIDFLQKNYPQHLPRLRAELRQE